MATFSYNKLIIIETDVLNYALGARLTQLGPDGKHWLVIFWLRKIIPAELNYDMYDKELLAIVLVF